jgi:cytochrome c oxidase assembly factor CtaG
MVFFLIILCFGYFFLNGFDIAKKSVYFFAGFLVLILSIASPLQFLGEHYLMSAHMLTHVMLLLVAPPLMVMGISKNSHHPFLEYFSEKIAARPWIAWFAGVMVMWFWHIPAIFNFTIENNFAGDPNTRYHIQWLLQDLQNMSLVLAGILFCWPIIGPAASKRLVPVKAVLYLTAACIFCSILGLMITFAPANVYTGYAHATDQLGYIHMIRQQGVTLLIDQQVAGLIMWVPGCLIYLSASMILLMNWFRGKRGENVFINAQKLQDGRG